MPTLPVQITGGAFQDLSGSPIANGYLLLSLNQDASANGTTQVAGGREVRVSLNANGNVAASPAQLVWPNDALAPKGTFYNVSVYTADGQLVWGPNPQQVLSMPAPFNLSAWTPSAVDTSVGRQSGSGNLSASLPLSVAGSTISVTGAVPVPNGGTGAGDATTARGNLGIGTLAVQPASAVSISGGSIDGTAIGSATPASGAFSTLSTTGLARFTGGFSVTGSGTFSDVVNTVFASAVQFTATVGLKPATNSTAVLNQNSTALQVVGYYWDGVNELDTWSVQSFLGSGSSPTSQLSIAHVGSSGATSVNIPYPTTFGSLSLSSAATASSAAAGSASALPGAPAGYVTVNINGVARKLPYFA